MAATLRYAYAIYAAYATPCCYDDDTRHADCWPATRTCDIAGVMPYAFAAMRHAAFVA